MDRLPSINDWIVRAADGKEFQVLQVSNDGGRKVYHFMEGMLTAVDFVQQPGEPDAKFRVRD